MTNILADLRGKYQAMRKPSVAPMRFHNGTPCMPWPGLINHKGYGKISIGGKGRQAHRAVYENVVGPIPDGLVIDHLCRNRCCVNPDHMEPVTNRENILRGEGGGLVKGGASSHSRGRQR